MIRKCNIRDLEYMVKLVYKKNNDSSHYSAFSSCKRELIEKDMINIINSKESFYVGYFDGELLIGLIGCFNDPERNNIDCCGPFVDGNFNKISMGMFDYVKTQFSNSYNYTFYFGKKNIECISFMYLIDAQNQGDEYQLILMKENYKKLNSLIPIRVFTSEYSEQLINLHDTIFPNVYISGRNIIESIGTSRQVFCAIKDSKLIGYCVLKIYENSQNATAEVISVDEEYRHQGYGRALLNKLLEVTFKNDSIKSIDLIVEQVNKNALGLYYSLGFDLVKENCFYIAK